MPPPAGSTTSPPALTTTIAPTAAEPASALAVPIPDFVARAMPSTLPTVAPVPAPTQPCAGRASARGRRGAAPGLDVGPGDLADREVEDHRGRDDRDADAARVVPDPLAGEMPRDAGGRLEPERAAAAQHDRVRPLDERPRAAEVGLARAGRGAADRDPGDRARAADDGGAPGHGVRVGVVPDLDAGDVGDRVVHEGGP